MPDVGDSLGRYTLLKRLAAGGMGEVFLAAKPGPMGFGPRVALKVLRDQLASDQQFIDMLVDEANISMFLNHQNVVSVLDLAEDRGSYYIAMEYVQGNTVEGLLEKLIAQGRKLDIPIGLYISGELCRALKYAHTRVNHAGEPLNIVHRDVTPANILLSVQGEVKLTDFGIARAKGRIHQTQAGVLKGKFGYMAPEMIRYESIDARADLFCAGVVIYLMLTGKHPVAGSTVMEAIQRYEDKQIPRPSQVHPDIPSTLDQIVMRALEPKPDHRWGSAAALGAALQDAILKVPAWRREVQDGAGRLADLMRELCPEAFVDPVEPEVVETLHRSSRPSEEESPPPKPRAKQPGPAPIAATDSAAETKLPPGPKPPPGRKDTGPVTDRQAQALALFNESTADSSTPTKHGDHDPGLIDVPDAAHPRIGITNPDLETEEGLALADVFAARDELARDRALEEPRVATLKKSKERRVVESVIEGGGSEDIPTGVGAQEPTMALSAVGGDRAVPIEVAFPDSSTDRHRLHEGLLDEPALPAKRGETTRREEFDWEGGSVPSDGEAAAEATVASYQYESNDQTDKPPQSDDRTVVGMYALTSDPAMPTPRDTDEHGPVDGHLSEPELPDLPAISESALDDGKTLAGVAMPDFAELDRARQPVILGPKESREDPDATRAYAAIDSHNGAGRREAEDAETVIPMGPDPWNNAKETQDATLLDVDGKNARQVQEAIAKAKKSQSSRDQKLQLPRPADVPGKSTKDTAEDLDRIVAESLVTGEHAPMSIDPTVDGPALFQGPVRIAFNTDGSPVFDRNGESLPPTASASSAEGAAAALAASASSSSSAADAAAKRKSGPAAREKKRGSDVPGLERSKSADGIPVKEELGVGPKTGKWMMGQLGSEELDWSDDAAARRAVAARNIGQNAAPPNRNNAVAAPQVIQPSHSSHPHGNAAPAQQQQQQRYPVMDPRYPQQQQPQPQYQQRSFLAANWTVIVALVAAVAAVGVVSALLLFTRVLWPKLRLESDPPGATVIVDGQTVEGRAPVMVKVEPEKSHTIEFRLDGYRTERRELAEGVGRGRTYALQVSLRRLVPTLDFGGVTATVFVNGKETGRGARVQLPDLAPEAPVKIRVEADGYRVWEISFERGAAVPETLDVPLQKAAPPKNPK